MPLIVTLLAAWFLFGGDSLAGAQETFFKGKTIRLIVGFSAGGGFDAYSRVLARHMGKHIPGTPAILVENMTGAGSMIAANYSYNQAKPDGLTIGNWIGGLILQQYLGAPGIAFDAAKVEWVGSPVQINNACVTTRRSGITSVERWLASKTPVKIGGESAGSTTTDIPRLLQRYSKLPIQLVEGYKGVADVRIAAESGEVAGYCSSWEGTKTSWRNVIESKEAVVVLQAVPKPHPDLPNVPLAWDHLASQEGKDLFKIVVHDVGGTINRLYSLPPGTPKDRVQTLQKAFHATMKDPEFLEDAKKTKLDIDPVSAEQIETAVAGIRKLPPEMLAKLKDVVLPGK
jgi:tripartite-type tricarboxylate transporter receptor subunit TctC